MIRIQGPVGLGLFAQLGKRWAAGLCATLVAYAAGLAHESKPISVPDTPKGFDTQYHKFVDEYWKAKEAERPSTFDQFVLPVSWFTDNFGSDHGPDFAQDYAEQFEDFRASTMQRIAPTEPCIGCMVNIKTNLDGSTSVSAPGIDLPPAQRFVIHSVVKDFDAHVRRVYSGSDISWMDSFVYFEGAFRFYGKGASTFLDPARVRLGDPCSKGRRQMGGQLISHPNPPYPEEAEKNPSKDSCECSSL